MKGSTKLGGIVTPHGAKSSKKHDGTKKMGQKSTKKESSRKKKKDDKGTGSIPGTATKEEREKDVGKKEKQVPREQKKDEVKQNLLPIMETQKSEGDGRKEGDGDDETIPTTIKNQVADMEALLEDVLGKTVVVPKSILSFFTMVGVDLETQFFIQLGTCTLKEMVLYSTTEFQKLAKDFSCWDLENDKYMDQVTALLAFGRACLPFDATSKFEMDPTKFIASARQRRRHGGNQ